MIRFSHEANSWLVLDGYSGNEWDDWDECTPFYARQMFDRGYLWIDY